jgi:hypothetical protein
MTYLYEHAETMKYLLFKFTIHGSNVMTIVSTIGKNKGMILGKFQSGARPGT